MSVTSGIKAGSSVNIQEMLKQYTQRNAVAGKGAYSGLSANANALTDTARSANEQASMTSPIVQAALKRAIKELEEQGEEGITFSKVSAYQKTLEEKFSRSVRDALKAKGLDEKMEFSIHLSNQGVISVKCDDPAAKATIEKYLSDNPKVCEEFGYIQALANVERARTTPSTLSETMKNIQATLQEAVVEAFSESAFGANGFAGYAGLMANFGSGGETAKFYTGLNWKV